MIQWYYAINDEQKGPISQDEMLELIQRGVILPETYVWNETLSDWAPAANALPSSFKSFDQPPPLPQTTPSSVNEASQSDRSDLSYEIACKPDYAFLKVKIPQGETIKVEASAMATMDTNISMKTKLKGGFGRLLTGESIFINEFTAQGGSGEIGIAPGTPGDIAHYYLDQSTIYLQNTAYVASGMGVELATQWQGLMKGFFSGESLFLIKASGKGDLWFNTYGGIIEIDVADGYVVDTGFIVAFTEGLSYQVRPVAGLKSLFFSGEGLVASFSGKGRVWIQTRKLPPFASWIYPFRPVKSDN